MPAPFSRNRRVDQPGEFTTSSSTDFDGASRPGPGSRTLGYGCALAAGSLWGTTGPLSTALYAQGTDIAGVGFWRILAATVGMLAYGLIRPSLFRFDRTAVLVVGVGGGVMVAVFEVSYQFAIAGAGVAGAAALLYTAPALVALLAWPLLGERLTGPRVVLSVAVMVGAFLTVQGGEAGWGTGVPAGAGLAAGVAGGILSALSYAGTTLLARFAVPRYGTLRVLFLEIAGGSVVLGALLPVAGRSPSPPVSAAGWMYVAALSLGSVVAANAFFFAGVRRIEAAPTAVAATIEPVVGALLALALFQQRLTGAGWLGLVIVVGSVAAGYWMEGVAPEGRG